MKGAVWKMRYGIIKKSVSTIYECAAETMESRGQVVSAISDEGLHGMMAVITGEEKQGFLPVRTFYGYEGYVKTGDLRLVSEEEGKAWENSNLFVVQGICVDVVSLPRVQGIRLISLYQGSMVNVKEWDSEEPGWAKVELADGRIGYMRNQYLRKKEFSQSALWTGTLPQKKIVDEHAFRQSLVETARTYMGVQYRWGGRSTAGIDCSGLVSSSYMLNGILIYRDARIEKGYPVHEISMEQMKMGDALYFPGHIAMYLGDGRYIHSTGKIGSGGVVCNSLEPGAPDYREDLVKSLYAVGSIF